MKIARLRFVAILIVIGLVITQWDLLIAYYEKWTRTAGAAAAGDSQYEWFCPMHPSVIRDNPNDKCPICFMPLSRRKKGEAGAAEPLPAGIVSRQQISPYRIVLAGVATWRTDVVARIINSLGLESVMFEAADPSVFTWYIKNYGPEVNLFVDHSQIVQLECLRAGIWGTKSLWGRVVTYKG